jgi:hypothetical protein
MLKDNYILKSNNKILSKATIQALTLKLDKKDTVSLSNRINQKLNKGDLSAAELALSIGFLPFEMHFGSFTDYLG